MSFLGSMGQVVGGALGPRSGLPQRDAFEEQAQRPGHFEGHAIGASEKCAVRSAGFLPTTLAPQRANGIALGSLSTASSATPQVFPSLPGVRSGTGGLLENGNLDDWGVALGEALASDSQVSALMSWSFSCCMNRACLLLFGAVTSMGQT